MPFECVSMRVWGCTALLLAGLMCVPEARAWEAVTDGLPDQAVVVVDKSRQRFFLMENGKSRDYLCTTGQAQGDKQVRGDLKTPEGVYFVVRKRTERLDFEEYGGEAYILDYPNPVDRLRGKTGSGIWVHSRGRAITPFESRGCVVLNLKDIAEVGPELKRGTPVLIGERVEIAPRKDAVREVEERTRGLAPRRGRGRVHCAGTCRIHKEGRAPRKACTGHIRACPGSGRAGVCGLVVCPAHGFARRRRGDGGTPPLLGETRRRRIPHRRNGMGRLAFLGFETVGFQLNVPPLPASNGREFRNGRRPVQPVFFQQFIEMPA